MWLSYLIFVHLGKSQIYLLAIIFKAMLDIINYIAVFYEAIDLSLTIRSIFPAIVVKFMSLLHKVNFLSLYFLSDFFIIFQSSETLFICKVPYVAESFAVYVPSTTTETSSWVPSRLCRHYFCFLKSRLLFWLMFQRSLGLFSTADRYRPRHFYFVIWWYYFPSSLLLFWPLLSSTGDPPHHLHTRVYLWN